MTNATNNVIAGDAALASFRSGMTGPIAINWMDEGAGRLLIQLPVGVGKTRYLVEIAGYARRSARPDALVVVMAPRRDVLAEIYRQFKGLKPLVLQPRLVNRCGGLDPQWKDLEVRGCGQLGRKNLCGQCPHRRTCAWPERQAEAIKGARLILATQQHLANDPWYIDRIPPLPENATIQLDSRGRGDS